MGACQQPGSVAPYGAGAALGHKMRLEDNETNVTFIKGATAAAAAAAAAAIQMHLNKMHIFLLFRRGAS
jgi:precorrin-4 methylase